MRGATVGTAAPALPAPDHLPDTSSRAGAGRVGPRRSVAWPAAVSPLVADVVAGPPAARPVLAVFPTCLYLGAGSHERVLAVLAADALLLPIGLRLTLRSTELDWGVLPTDEVVVGDGRLRLPRADVVAVRTQLLSRVVSARTVAGSPLDVIHALDEGNLAAAAAALTAAALEGPAVHSAVAALVGAGRGLTPSGDDALCGVLLALRALDLAAARDAHARLSTAVRSLTSRTTSLSAALLLAAAQGYAVPDVVRLATALTRSADPSEVEEVLGRVLAIGHSSGADLVSGLSGALRAVAATQPSSTPAPASSTPEGNPRG